jgi:hypothetical protein
VADPDPTDRDRDGVPDREEEREERLVDRDGDSAVYRSHTADRDDAAREAHERTEARLAARERLAANERVEEREAAREATAEREAREARDAGEARHARDPRDPGTTAVIDRDRDGVDDRVQAPPAPPTPTAPPEPRIRARSSLLATLALMVGLTSVYAALSGRLAPVAVVLGVLGLLLSFGGLSASGRPRVAGGGMALFALLLSVGGAVLGVLAITDATPWLDSDVDQVAKLRDWLDSQFTFMKGW